ncbi:MAG TPA: hypothetical protein VM101_14180 [Flavitalea sp.]|nr:hypothetical protein [Flavitalea sp.]
MRVLLVLVLLPLQILSQDLTGIWTGLLQTNGSDLPYEVVISNEDGKLTGYSLTIFNIDGIENVGIKAIRLKNKHGSIFIEDDKLIYNNYMPTSRRLKLLGELLYRVHDTVMTLKGIFRTRSLDFREQNNPFTGTITLQKLHTPQVTKLISTLEEMDLMNTLRFMTPEKSPVKVEIKKDIAAASDKPEKSSRKKRPPAVKPKKEIAPPAPAVVVAAENKMRVPDTVKAAAELASRKTEVIQNVFFTSDSLILKLYDHGVIDGDTVSVVLNGRVIAARQRLAGKPIVSVIHLTPDLGDSLLLVMYAENLGSIPPNTGLLIVLDGDNRYEIRFEGTKQKSSAILLTRKRK